jgi:MYXO-CTERM domain-containing protein
MKVRVLCLTGAMVLGLAGASIAQTDGTRLSEPVGGASHSGMADPRNQPQTDLTTPADDTADTTDYNATAATDVDVDTDATLDSDTYATTGTTGGVEDETDALPQTASPLAAIALTGLASLAGAFGLRRRRS